MTEPSKKSTPDTFPTELRSLYSLCLLSLVLGALALALGLSSIVNAIVAMAAEGSFGVFRLVQAFTGWAALVIGFRWVMSTAGILKGVGGVLRDCQVLEGSGRQESAPGAESTGGAVPPEALDALFLRMMAHYRANWKTWWKMRLIAAAGGWIFICLGVLDFMEGYPAWQAGVVPNLPFFGGGISIALGVAAILVSSRFQGSARTWERRLIDAGQGDEILQEYGVQRSS
jgi:hypothetical protein